MHIHLSSLQIGAIVSEGDAETRDPMARFWTTGFYKRPVPHPVRLTQLGLEGDRVADTKHHGGIDKAILCYAESHYARWRQEFPDLDMSAGALAENLTIGGADESSICIGDRFRFGDCEIEISQPRQPCWKIARRWGVKTLTKCVTQNGRTGWYARVISEGTMEAGMRGELTSRPHPKWTIARANDLMFGREIDRSALIELMSIPALADAWKKDIA